MSSQSFSSELIANLVALGVRHFYLSPGSRSQALALAAYSMETAGEATLSVRLDERSMAFTALGRSLASGEPIGVITTSGTAVANLHPAVLEAHHAGVPLILLTADRPSSLRGKGANQTTNQVGIFNDAVRLCVDADESFDAKELATLAVKTSIENHGPVQLNLQFREPLSDNLTSASQVFADLKKSRIDFEEISAETITLQSCEKTVVIAGAGATAQAGEFAQAYGLPLFAEPSSGARHFPNSVLRYSELLRSEFANEIEQVIVFGKPTLNRSVTKLLIGCKQVQVVRNKNFGHFDIAGNAQHFADGFSFGNSAPAEWLAVWQAADADLPEPESFSRGSIVRAIWAASKEQDAIVLGASKLVREADLYAPRKRVQVFSNRGLAGIDGTTSTALGIAQETTGTTRALIGDLTVLHDIGGLNLTGVAECNLQIIVVNDHGGKIFDQLEVKQSTSDLAFEKLFRTPQQFDLQAISRGFGWDYQRVSDQAGLLAALELPGRTVIEIELD